MFSRVAQISRRLIAIGAICLTAALAALDYASLQAAVIERTATNTLTAVEMDHGDTLRFTRQDGHTRTLLLEDTWAEVVLTNLANTKKGRPGGGTIYRFGCRVVADGQPMTMIRYVPVQQSFYEPYVINGVRIWFDGVRKIGQFFNETHGACVPGKAARFALQDATLPICAEEPLRPWYPNADNYIDVRECYNGDDTWMGPYFGADLHGGLDVNMAIGTPLWTPLSFDDQFYFNSLAAGDNNNRWRAIRRFSNGERWVLQAHHITRLLVPEHTPIEQNVHFAVAAGVRTGSHAHSHFEFKVGEEKQEILLDPWILFWQIFENNKDRAGAIRAGMAPVGPARTGEPIGFAPEGSRPGVLGNGLTYLWTFGDGGCSIDNTPTHVYVRAGVYPVTLMVSDGVQRTATTQHICVSGPEVAAPVLAIVAPEEVEFAPRPAAAMDVYGKPVDFVPHTLRFLARRPNSQTPATKGLALLNLGAGELAKSEVRIEYPEVEGWARVDVEGAGNGQTMNVGVNASKLSTRHGVYHAHVFVDSPGAINSPQVFSIELTVRPFPAPSSVVVDDRSPACYVSPWFWLAPRFHGPWPKGYNETYLVAGGPLELGGRVRFRPDLAAGQYEVRLRGETPVRPTEQCPDTVRYRVRVRDRNGLTERWIEPLKSREIGTFDFSEGADGYVELDATDAEGLVVADAVEFKRVQAPPDEPAVKPAGSNSSVKKPDAN
ncbi:MAG: PKD domain-containing protein [Planctomycetota bacterium]